MNKIIDDDLERIYQSLSVTELRKFKDSTILITGCGGFLGYYFTQFFLRYANKLGLKKVIGLDNFIVNRPQWLDKLLSENIFEFYKFNIITDDISTIASCKDVTFILHMASIASPTFYRQHPIETLDANVWGLRRLLDYYVESKELKGFLFFSSSEIYGDPTPDSIPTPEKYNGNVSCLGPRACYDEAKRFGETLCYLFNQKYGMPLTVVRPFNNYGPGMRLNDKRVPADFAKAVIENRDIVIFSDGEPTRTFCYISDAITGYLKAMLYGAFSVFNIGIEKPEISIKELAEIYRTAGKELFGYSGSVIFNTSKDREYLTNNPNRRCPNIEKASKSLSYEPKVSVSEGVRYFLRYINESREEGIEW